MKKRYITAFFISLIVLGLTYKFWFIIKTTGHIKFDFYPFCIVLILSYLGGLKLANYLIDFKRIKNCSGIDIAFLVIFFILLFIPMSYINKDEKSEKENRNLAQYPKIIKEAGGVNYKFGNEFDAWYNDRFFLRNNLIWIYENKYHFNVHNDVPKVLFGSDGWLFYKGEEFNSIQSYQNVNLFKEDELKYITKYFSDVDKYCKKHNKHFYVFITPDKSKVYSEYYPSAIRKIKPDDKSRVNQLISYIKENSNVKVVYPIDTLLKNKENGGLLYYKKDTHWNLLGAYWASIVFLDEIKKDFPYLNVYKTANYKEEEYFGDLYNMLPEIFKNTKADKYKVPDLSDMHYSCKATESAVDIQNCTNKNGKLELVMYRDSFATSLIPYFAETFMKSTFIWDYKIKPEFIKDSNVVIYEMVERNIDVIKNLRWDVK